MRRSFLLPLAFAYRGLMAVRNVYYDWLPLASHAAGVPVISVGNLSTGGTGKTPMTIDLVGRLVKRGRRPAILTRGYAAAAGQIADEVQEFHEALPDVAVVVDADRVRGAATARRRFNVDCLVLDDGFQHRRLRRDLDVVLIDAMNPWGGGAMLPAGRLREPPAALRRASLVVVTRVNLVEQPALAVILQRVRAVAPAASILQSRLVVERLTATDATSRPPDALSGRPVMAVSGVGNPASFSALLARYGARLAAAREFRDHYAYGRADAVAVAAAARRSAAEWVVTTRKDWVKLLPLWQSLCDAPPLVRVDVRMEWSDPRLLDEALERVAPPTGRSAPPLLDPTRAC